MAEINLKTLQQKREEVSARALAEARKKTGMRAEDVGPPDLKGAEEQDARWRKSARDSAASERETARKIREGIPVGGDSETEAEQTERLSLRWLEKFPQYKNDKFWRENPHLQEALPIMRSIEREGTIDTPPGRHDFNIFFGED